MRKLTIDKLEEMARQVRRDSLRMISGAQSGHPGGALGCADFLTALYFRALRKADGGFSSNGHKEDVFFLSNGHISAAWYSVLARSGHFPVEHLALFRRMGSRLQGHPTCVEGLPGVRVASGSLGQGLSVACGVALAKKMRKENRIVYVLMGDGELQEGQIWEAAMFASARSLDNLIATVDYNKVQIDGPLDQSIPLGDLAAKWSAFGWQVLEIEGNNMESVVAGLVNAGMFVGKGKPIVILMHTKMGFGVDFMCDDYKWHGKAPSEQELERALEQLEPTLLGDY